MNIEDLSRKIILDHYKFPRNKITNLNEENFLHKKSLNPSCGDEVEIFLKISENKIEKIYFSGSGCSICCSSASILTDELLDLTVEEAKNKIKEFENMLNGVDFNDSIFEDASALESLKDFPARFKCAFISWNTLNDLLLEGDFNE